MARRVRGDKSFRRMLDKIGNGQLRVEVRARLQDLGEDLLSQQQVAGRFQNTDTPHSSAGDLRNALAMRITPKTLVLKVGLLGKAVNRRLFYGWFIEWGRKGGGRGVKRGSAKYNAGVGAMAPDMFVHGKDQSATIRVAAEKFRGFWHKVLMDAAQGAYDD